MLLSYKNKLGKSNVAKVSKPVQEQREYNTLVTFKNDDPYESSKKAEAYKHLAEAKNQERLKKASIASNQSVEELKREETFKPLTDRLDRYFMGEKQPVTRGSITTQEKQPIQGLIPSMKMIQDYIKNLANNVEILRSDAKNNILENLITISDKLENSNSAVSDAILELADSINNSTHLTNDTLKDIKESLNIIREEIKPTPSMYEYIEASLNHIEDELSQNWQEFTPEQLNNLQENIDVIKSDIEDLLMNHELNKKDSEMLDDMYDKAEYLMSTIERILNGEYNIGQEDVKQIEAPPALYHEYEALASAIENVRKNVNRARSVIKLQSYKDELKRIAEELVNLITSDDNVDANVGIIEEMDEKIEEIEDLIDNKIEEITSEGLKPQEEHDERRRREEERSKIKQPEFQQAVIDNLVKVEEYATKDYPSRDRRIDQLFDAGPIEGQTYIGEIIDVFSNYENRIGIDFDRHRSVHPDYVIDQALQVLQSAVVQYGQLKEKRARTEQSALKNDMVFTFLNSLTNADKVWHGEKIINRIESMPLTLRGKDNKIIIENIKKWMKENPEPKLNIIA